LKRSTRGKKKRKKKKKKKKRNTLSTWLAELG